MSCPHCQSSNVKQNDVIHNVGIALHLGMKYSESMLKRFPICAFISLIVVGIALKLFELHVKPHKCESCHRTF